MKLYYPKDHYDDSYRGATFPLLKAFIKEEGFTDRQRIGLYHVSEKDFQFVETLSDADLTILTMSWNYYHRTQQVSKAIDFIRKCEILGKKVLVWNSGDFGLKVPNFENLIVLRESGYRSKFSKKEFTVPSFIMDPLEKYYNTTIPFELSYTSKPVIGFCGHASLSKLKAVKELVLTSSRNIKYYLGQSKKEPQEMLPTTHLRASLLNRLEQSERVDTLFVRRDQYRASVTTEKDTHSTTLEFYENLKNAPYVLCVRGGGNFSVRFYEALAMGRVPVFINTDCSLPFHDIVDWKKHVVWVEYKDRNQLAQKVDNFHKALTEKDFIALQYANRKLWEEKLTLGGFFKNYLLCINK